MNKILKNLLITMIGAFVLCAFIGFIALFSEVMSTELGGNIIGGTSILILCWVFGKITVKIAKT